MEKIEQKIKIESEITSLNRDRKRLSAEVEALKEEVGALINTKEKYDKLIEDQRFAQKEILNEISESRLRWSQEKNKEMDDIADQRREISQIIEKGKELDKQEDKINTLIDKNTELLKEKRQETERNKHVLEEIKAEKRQLEVDKKEIEKIKVEIEEKEKEFKNELKTLVKKYG